MSRLDGLKDSIAALSARERVLLRLAFVIAPLLVAWLLLLQPALAARNAARYDYEQALLRLRDAGIEAAGTGGACAAPAHRADAGSDAALVDSARRAGLVAQPQREAGSLVLRLDGASGDAMLAWASELMCAGVAVHVLSIAPAAQTGRYAGVLHADGAHP